MFAGTWASRFATMKRRRRSWPSWSCKAMHSKVTAAVIGIGNPARGDDGAGREVARLLADIRRARVVETNGDATDLLKIWRGVETCVIIDAVSSGERPGFIHRLRVQE